MMPSTQKNICGAVWILAITFLSLAAMGHNFAAGNHVIYLIWIERLRDSNFLPNDWYLTTSIMHPNIVYALRYLGDWLGDANGFLVALGVSRLLLVAAVWKLAMVVIDSGKAEGCTRVHLAAGMAALLAVFSPRVSLGGHFPSGSYFEASHMGMALATLSLAYVIERRYVWAGIWLGATIHIHLFLGAHVALIEALAVVFMANQLNELPRSGRLMSAIKDIMHIALPAFALGSYTLVSSAVQYVQSSAANVSGRDVVEILAFRHPHHHSPLSWEPLPGILFMLYIALGLLLARRRLTRDSDLSQIAVLRALFFYSAMAMIVGTVFVEWIPVSLVALFQFFRVTVLLMIWMCVEVGLWLSGHIVAAWQQRRVTATSLLALLALLTFRIPYLFLPLAGMLLFRGMGILPVQSSPTRSNASIALGIFAAITGVFLTVLGATGRLNPLFALAKQPQHFRTTTESSSGEINALASWIRSNTPEDAIILAPPGMEGLGLFSRRAGVVTFKQVTFTPPELREWFYRITDVSMLGRKAERLPITDWRNVAKALQQLHHIRRQRENPQVMIDRGYELLSSNDVLDLAEKYRATWFVTTSRKRYAFEQAATVGRVAVYRVD